ncbi:hypothetical protein BpHYR1_006863 [Brachionus plicatilis]|uniref:Uncharacterized protein n=1 Tax=Brachionus plicatilis TaxID=10195 RepID=A0A3M7P9K5_BRAPC|nr:hypothetical protein BpHYR1_006863 [Brachionus plicatilis]
MYHPRSCRNNIHGGSKKPFSGFNFRWKKKISKKIKFLEQQAKEVTKRVEKTPPGDNHFKIETVLWPDLNPTEMVWNDLKHYVIPIVIAKDGEWSNH